MATTFESALDSILGTLKVRWDTDTPGITTTVPSLVYETFEQDLKPHPKDGSLPWARAVVRHVDARKVTLANSDSLARYRRTGIVWVQIFVPSVDATTYVTAQRLAVVAQKAYEGKSAMGGEVVFTKAAIIDRPKEGAFWRFDVQAQFYWDEIK